MGPSETWLFVGPTLLAGIGQVTRLYSEMVKKCGHEADFVSVGEQPPRTNYDRGFSFVLPIESTLNMFDQYKQFCNKMMYMTVCETVPVNPCYGILKRYSTIHVPSEFARTVLSNQFPDITWKTLLHWAPVPVPRVIGTPEPYVFYTIGNILDPRKNIRALVETFLRCDFKNEAILFLKATCNQPVDWKVPGVHVINGLLAPREIDDLHARCHCYINCSHSEGVGMGAVEAALWDKPCIITDFGGLKEYIKTPWMVPCTQGPIGFNDYLYTPELQWGYPSKDQLAQCMRDCFERKVRHWDHSHTKQIMQDLQHSEAFGLH
jgi:glycosyltransferase involved in cell wall biosynthesis